MTKTKKAPPLDNTLFSRDLTTTTKDMARMFHDPHNHIMHKVLELKDADPEFFDKHFTPMPAKKGNGGPQPGYEMSLAGFLVLANMFGEPHYSEYLQEVQSVCIDLDIILRGPMKNVRELAWSVPLEDMAETIKANIAPLLGHKLTDQEQRRRDFAFALIDRLNPDMETEPGYSN